MNSKKRIKNAVAQGRGVDSAKIAESNKNSPSLAEGARGWVDSKQSAESSLKIGIVIPIYNVAPYLNECLDSVANQTYKNFHAVLVNDGSTDESRQIALDYVAKDSRFVLIDKENGGLSSARNAGINYFSGELNSSLGMQFRTCENFGESTDSSLVLSPKFSQIQKPHRKILEFGDSNQGNSNDSQDFCDSKNDKNKSARSANPCKSFCYFLLSQKVESSLPLNLNLPKRQTQNLTLYHNAKSTPNPPQIDYIIFLDSDDFWEKDLLEICGKVAESSADSAPSTQGVNSSIVDEFLQLHEASDTDRTLSPSRKRGECDCEKSPQDAEFTTPPRFAITNPSIIWFGFKTFGAKARTGDPLDLFAFKDIATISPREWILRAQQAGIGQFWFSWGGMMDFRFLCEKKLQFLEGALYEDELFGVQSFAQSRAICVLPKKLYNYRIRESSLASSAHRKSLPPSLAHLRGHFSDENIAWQYFCASSFARILVESVAFFERLDDKALAMALKRAFLPTLFARSCDILGFRCDPYLMKARVVELLKENGRYSSALNLLAKIPHKRARYTIFLSYFAPKLVWGRIKRRIKLLFVAESRLDSAISQNLVKNNSVRSTQTRPLRGAKNQIQASSSASADFLLEAERRGSPPKSEKRQLLARRGSEVGGAALLRKKSSEISGSEIAESIKDSQGGLPRRAVGSSRNDDSFLDSANQTKIAESALDSAKSGDLRG